MTRRVAVLGLGEAGARYATDLLSAGMEVVGYDPAPTSPIVGLRAAENPAAAVAGAQVVLSLNSATAAIDVACEAMSALAAGVVYADLNATTPRAKVDLAAQVQKSGALFADVAVLAPVPRAGLRTPLLVAGSGRERFTAFARELGVPVADGGPTPGTAAGAKLMRSVFMKGLAAVIGEALDAAEAAAAHDWLRGQIVAELAAADDALVTRLVEGSRRHASRRHQEMTAAVEYLDELGVSTHLSKATARRLAALASGTSEA